MSLDIVELIMAIEEKFKVSIPNVKAAQMTTADKVYHHMKSAMFFLKGYLKATDLT